MKISHSESLWRKEQIVDMITEHPELTFKQVAEILGFSEGYVSEVAKEFGLSRPRGGLYNIGWRREQVVDAIIASPDLTYEMIGKPLDITRQRVQQIARSAGIKRR